LAKGEVKYYSAASSIGHAARSSAKRALISSRHCPQLNAVLHAFITQLIVNIRLKEAINNKDPAHAFTKS